MLASALSLSDHAVRILSALVISPLLIQGLGVESYGLWLLVLSFIGYLEFLDLGLANTTVRFFSITIEGKDAELLSPLFYRIRRHYRMVGLGIMAISLVGALIINTRLSSPNRSAGALLFLVLGLAQGLAFQLRVYPALLKAHLRYTGITLASTLRVALFTLAIFWFRRYQLTLYTLLSVHVFLILTEQLVLFLAARHLVPKRTDRNLAPDTQKQLVSYASKIVVASAAGFFRERIDTQLLAAYVSLSAVTQYAVGMRFPGLFLDLSNSVFGGHLMSAFGIKSSRNEGDDVSDSLLSVLRVSSSFAIIGGVGLFFLGPPFIDRWLGPGFGGSADILRITVPGMMLIVLQYPVFTFLAAINRYGRVVSASLIGSLVNFVASFILVQWIGLTGVVWATGCENVLYSAIVLPCLAAPLLGMSALRMAVTTILLPMLRLCLPLGLLTWLYCSHFHPATYLEIIVAGIAISLAGFALSWIWVLKQAEQQFIIAQMARILQSLGVPLLS